MCVTFLFGYRIVYFYLQNALCQRERERERLVFATHDSRHSLYQYPNNIYVLFIIVSNFEHVNACRMSPVVQLCKAKYLAYEFR